MTNPKHYTTNEMGIINNPGKFEGEPLYAPYFWHMSMEGWAYEDDGETYTFKVTAEDKAKFPDLSDVTHVHLRESESGFVYTSIDRKET